MQATATATTAGTPIAAGSSRWRRTQETSASSSWMRVTPSVMASSLMA